MTRECVKVLRIEAAARTFSARSSANAVIWIEASASGYLRFQTPPFQLVERGTTGIQSGARRTNARRRRLLRLRSLPRESRTFAQRRGGSRGCARRKQTSTEFGKPRAKRWRTQVGRTAYAPEHADSSKVSRRRHIPAQSASLGISAYSAFIRDRGADWRSARDVLEPNLQSNLASRSASIRSRSGTPQAANREYAPPASVSPRASQGPSSPASAAPTLLLAAPRSPRRPPAARACLRAPRPLRRVRRSTGRARERRRGGRAPVRLHDCQRERERGEAKRRQTTEGTSMPSARASAAGRSSGGMDESGRYAAAAAVTGEEGAGVGCEVGRTTAVSDEGATAAERLRAGKYGAAVLLPRRTV